MVRFEIFNLVKRRSRTEIDTNRRLFQGQIQQAEVLRIETFARVFRN